MFSGIIETKIKAKEFIKTKDGLRIVFKVPKSWKVILGESINIDGVCSTIESIKSDEIVFFYMPETLSKTTLGSLKSDHEFNLEKSLTLNSLVGGHLVTGHIDTTATVLKIIEEDKSKKISFLIDKKFAKYIIYKGSICVNGVSLTITEILGNEFSVSLIPHTLKVTNLGNLKKGENVNIEVDLIGKYLEKLIKKDN